MSATCRILPGMDTMVAGPGWAAPAARSVLDATRLAHRLAGETGRPRDAGRAVALRWATLGGPPLLGDGPDDTPPTQAQVLRVLTAVDSELRYLPPSPERERLVGHQQGLQWLVAGTGLGLDLPARHPDGQLMTVEDLYRPEPWWEPEQQRDARRVAERTVARSARLAELAS